jgi:predicted PurR-regulated permease PerM
VLSFIVFICSFVPVAGVFLSTLPMAVAALGEYGVSKVCNTCIHYL